MSAKAVVVFDANGSVVIGAECRLQDFTFPNLTNNDGYALSPRGHTSGKTYVRVLMNGYSPAVYPVVLDAMDQEIHLGGPNTGGNTIYLPPLSFRSAPVKEPTREQVCNVFVGFQGISILTKQFGWIPAFGPECGALTDEDTVSYCAQMKKFGFTHVEMDISWRYVEPGYAYPVSGMDLSQNLLELCRRMNLIINQGMMIKLALSGDRMSINDDPQPGEYNDPQGWTYGYQWLMNNLARIIAPMINYKGRNLTKWTIFVPGYDGVFYGWGIEGEVPDRQPERVINFGKLFRSILPDGNLGLEHSTGKIPVGESGIDWTNGGPLDAYDTLLSEFDPFNLHSDNTWQILGRCTRPYNRPPDQPAHDDPNPPYIIEPCSRGERFYIMYELLTYLWVRGLVSIGQCNQAFDYFKAMAPNATLCMIRQNP